MSQDRDIEVDQDLKQQPCLELYYFSEPFYFHKDASSFYLLPIIIIKNLMCSDSTVFVIRHVKKLFWGLNELITPTYNCARMI